MSDPSIQAALAQAFQSLRQRRFALAEQQYLQIIARDAKIVEAHNGLGSALTLQRKYDSAIQTFSAAMAMDPDNPNASCNLGIAFHRLGRYDEAIASFNSAIRINPDWPVPHVNLGMILLLRGDYRAGFAEQAWRLKIPALRRLPQEFPWPLWEGCSPAGRRILIYPDQGFGDFIQFLRFVPLVEHCGGQVVLAVPPELIELVQAQGFRFPIVTCSDPLPAFDIHSPVTNLANVLGITLETLQNRSPYIVAPRQKIEHWPAVLPGSSGKLKIGLLMSGSAIHSANDERSISADSLAEFVAVDGIECVDLRHEPADSPPFGVRPLAGQIHNFADSAAVLHQLDLVITVDTAIAHLAGAMGKPVWVLLPYVPDWRWMLGRNDSPWYPTARLFRQPVAGDWRTPMDQIVTRLRSKRLFD